MASLYINGANRNMETKNYTYILRCADGTFYTGWTTDLKQRVNKHNAGNGAKYTRPRRPVELVYYEVFETKEEAMRREWQIKQLPRKEKLKLIEAGKRLQDMVHHDIMTEAAADTEEMEDLVRTKILVAGIEEG